MSGVGWNGTVTSSFALSPSAYQDHRRWDVRPPAGHRGMPADGYATDSTYHGSRVAIRHCARFNNVRLWNDRLSDMGEVRLGKLHRPYLTNCRWRDQDECNVQACMSEAETVENSIRSKTRH